MATTFCSVHCRDCTFSIHEMSRRRQKKVRRREWGEIRRSSLGWRAKLEAAADQDAVNGAPLLNHVSDVKCVPRARTWFYQCSFTYDYQDMNKVEQTEPNKQTKYPSNILALQMWLSGFHIIIWVNSILKFLIQTFFRFKNLGSTKWVLNEIQFVQHDL